MVITALLTCFNRKKLTLACLDRLFAASLPERMSLRVVLVDDGSRDGTHEAVAEAFPQVTVIKGNGSLYWCGGMLKAWRFAEDANPEFLLMLNDDTMLEPGALLQLLAIAGTPEALKIAVGAVADPVSGALTYGGRRRNHPGSPVPLEAEPTECDTFNGNCVLIPRAVRKQAGEFYGGYTHSFSDFDYGIQARKLGIGIFQTTSVVGTCSSNSIDGTWKDLRLGRIDRLRKLNSPKGMPWRDHLTFARRTQGGKWLKHFAGPYVRILLGR